MKGFITAESAETTEFLDGFNHGSAIDHVVHHGDTENQRTYQLGFWYLFSHLYSSFFPPPCLCVSVVFIYFLAPLRSPCALR